MIDAAGWLFLLLQVFFVDLLLGADNAIVIALACRRLPPNEAQRAVALGAAGAIILRLGMVLFADALLGVPLIKLLGAWMLFVIALNVKAHRADDDIGASRAASASDFVSAAAAITLADAAMSLDNVIALAAIAGGNFLLLAIGVLLSIPILAYGALILTHIIRRAPEVLTIGVGFLGWIAGGMAVSDPLVSGWIAANAPALPFLAPALAAAFVLIAGSDARPGQAKPARAIPPVKAPASSPRPLVPTPAVREAAASAEPVSSAEEGRVPGFAPEASIAAPDRRWGEERIVVAGFVLLAFLAGLIIFIASFFDSLT